MIRKALGLGLLALIYFGAGRLGLALAQVHSSASAVWPPTGIALAAALLFGTRVWPAILVGAFLVNFTNSGWIPTSLGIAAGNTLEMLAGAFLVGRFARGTDAFNRPSDIFRFALVGGLIAGTVSATIGVTSVGLSDAAARQHFGSIWVTWWLGDAMGALLFTPLVILWWKEPRRLSGDPLEAALWMVLLVAVGAGFAGLVPFVEQHYPMSFVAAPLIIAIAFRFGPREAVTAAVLLSTAAVWGTVHGRSPFVWRTPNDSLLLLQTFMGVTAATALAVGAVVADHRKIIRSQKLLSEASGALGASLDYESTLKTVSTLLVPSLGSACVFDVVRADGSRQRIGTPAAHEGATFPLKARQRDIGELVVWDPTDRKLLSEVADRAALAIDNALLYLQAQEAIRSREEFLSIASHELRTPLTSQQLQLQGVIRTARRGEIESMAPERILDVLETVKRQGDRLSHLINNLLDLSRITAGKLKITLEDGDLAEIARTVIERSRGDIERSQSTVSLEAPAPVKGRWDKLRLDQVVTNLLVNALKYGQGKPVGVAVSADERRAVLCVRDQGIGIRKDDVKRLFRPFERAVPLNNYGGLGLGLYIVRQVVEAHGGSIAVESEPGRGSVFTVELPLLPPE